MSAIILSTSTDLCIATFLINETFPKKWINRLGFVYSRKLLILMWLMFASNLLLWSYKSTLLSTLITINYENPINTLEDVDRSGLPVMVAKNTVLHWLIATDPRPTTKSILKKSVVYPFNGTTPAWTNKRYALKNNIYIHRLNRLCI